MAKYLDHDGVAYLWSKIKATFAPLASPTFTGTPIAPTATTGDNSTQIATTAFVQNTVGSLATGVTGVKGDVENSYRTGNVNLTAANVGALKSIVVGGASYSAASEGDTVSLVAGSNITLLKENDTPYPKITISSTDTNTDTKVTQTVTSANSTYPILFTNTADRSATATDTARFCTAAKINASNGNITCGKISTDGTNFYEVGAAAEKAIGSVANGNTGLVTGGAVYTAVNGRAPTSHASTATTYGAGTNSNYGHVKLSDATNGTAAAASGGTAATPKAVSDALTAAKTYADGLVVGAVQYQGTATSNSDLGTAYKKGYYWIVGSAGGTIAGQTVEAGDMVIAHANYSGTVANDVDIVQSNITRITNAEIDAIIAAA